MLANDPHSASCESHASNFSINAAPGIPSDDGETLTTGAGGAGSASTSAALPMRKAEVAEIIAVLDAGVAFAGAATVRDPTTSAVTTINRRTERIPCTSRFRRPASPHLLIGAWSRRNA